MDARFSIKAVTAALIQDLKCPAATVSSLAGLNSGKLSRILRGHEQVGGADELALRKAVNSLRRLSEFSKPFPLDWREFDQIRTCIDLMERGQLKIILMATPELNLTDETNPLPAAGILPIEDDDGIRRTDQRPKLGADRTTL
jgi:hypothetical protein